MGSVCGQHDFVDLVGLNDAIFCRGGGEGAKELESLWIVESWVSSSSAEHRLHKHTAESREAAEVKP